MKEIIIRRNTEWGRSKVIKVSFQKLTNKFVCFQGNGKKEGIIGWGKTELESARNLIKRLKKYEGFNTA